MPERSGYIFTGLQKKSNCNMKTILTIIFSSLLSLSFAQTQLMHINIDTLRQPAARGENMSKFVHLYTSLLYTTPPSEDLGVQYGKSYALNVGLRYKKKITGLLSVNADVAYNYRRYRLSDNCSPVISDPELEICIHYDKEIFAFNSAKANAAIRINLDPKRGNIMGTFIDIGGGAEYIVGSKYIVYTESPAWHSKSAKVKYSSLSIINKYNYFGQVRIGRNRYALTASYRLSDMFDKFYPNHDLKTEFPRLNVGVEVGLF